MHVEVRGQRTELTPGVRQFVEGLVAVAVRNHEARVDHISVSLAVLEDPQHGRSQRCQIDANLAGKGTVVAEGQGDGVERAVIRAADQLAGRVGDVLRSLPERGLRGYHR